MSEGGKGSSAAVSKGQTSAPKSIPARAGGKRAGHGLAGSAGRSPRSPRSPHSFSLEEENYFSRIARSPGGLSAGTAIDLESFHVGQLWRDTGIALVGNGDFSIRLHCQRQPLAGSNEQSNLVIRVGRGGAFHVLEEGHCIIGLAAQRHVTKKNKTYLVPDHCMCVVKDSKPVLISCGVAVLRKRAGVNEIVLKRGSNSAAFVAIKQRLHVFMSGLASHGRAKGSVEELTTGIEMWCDFELDLIADMSETSMRCLFGSGSKQQLFRESWSSLFAVQPPSLRPLQELQECAEIEQARRRGLGKLSEDQKRPWTLPKGNFSHVGTGAFEQPSECAARELKAETGMEWTESLHAAAVYVDVLRPDSTMVMERFFLWRDDTLAVSEEGEVTGDKQWRWFSFQEASKRSPTAKILLDSAQVKQAMKDS